MQNFFSDCRPFYCYSTGKEKGSPGQPADADPTAPDSESVIVAMERVSVLFDRYVCLLKEKFFVLLHFCQNFYLYDLRKSHGCSCYRIRKGFPSEARVVSRILPQFLDDFFPLQDVMNKVIGEFLSNQQPYPQFMATVVYKASAVLPYF